MGITDKKLREIFAALVRCTRHIRNFPHPELTIQQLRREATIAEQQLQTAVGPKEWDKINEIAFSE